VTPMLIMVVEDEPISALSAMWELQRAGHEVIGPASCQEDALRLAREWQPELALVDIDLRHVGEGVDLARDLRDLHVAAVFVSAQSSVAQENRDLALGLISKPYTLSELVVSVGVIDSVLHGDVPQPPAIPDALRLFD
jgi:DNA-binding response OmpR family regulator